MYNTIEEMFLDKSEKIGEEREKKGRIEGLLDGIELGLETKFGQEGLKEVPQINKLDDINVLMAIQRGLWSMDSLGEISKLYR